MNNDIEYLKNEIEKIKKRNKSVETDKAWETSTTRKISIAIVTYLIIGIYMQTIKVNEPWLNAIVPTIGFFLSTLTLDKIKQLWIKKHQQSDLQKNLSYIAYKLKMYHLERQITLNDIFFEPKYPVILSYNL